MNCDLDAAIWAIIDWINLILIVVIKLIGKHDIIIEYAVMLLYIFIYYNKAI